MHKITVIAISAAAAAGIIAAAVLFYPTLNVGGIDRRIGEPYTPYSVVQNDVNSNSTAPSDNDSINSGYQQMNITINRIDLVADIAATSEQQSKGLSIKDSLNESEAMIFPFHSESQHAFWMKDMKFAIDIIWISSDKKVVHIEHSLPPCISGSLCPVYAPGERSLYVLETMAGFAQRYDVTEGTLVQFELVN